MVIFLMFSAHFANSHFLRINFFLQPFTLEATCGVCWCSAGRRDFQGKHGTLVTSWTSGGASGSAALFFEVSRASRGDSSRLLSRGAVSCQRCAAEWGRGAGLPDPSPRPPVLRVLPCRAESPRMDTVQCSSLDSKPLDGAGHPLSCVGSLGGDRNSGFLNTCSTSTPVFVTHSLPPRFREDLRPLMP